MSKGREIHCYDYVNHPYDEVRALLCGATLAVFRRATRSAAHRVESVAAELHASLGVIEVGTEIEIEIDAIEEKGDATIPAKTILHLRWEAAKSPRLFPIMRAELAIYALTATETQLDFLGHYEPPLGPLGTAVNALVGHRIAEVSVHRLIGDVADFLRKALGK